MRDLNQLKGPCSQAAYGLRQPWSGGQGVGCSHASVGCTPGADRGADQQQDPCPVKHNPGGLR